MKYQQFIFEDYQFDPSSKRLSLRYSLDGQLSFTETFTFDFAFADYDPVALDRALQALFFMAGVSYYKTYIPPELVSNKGQIDEATAQFLNKTYQRGLGEFWYVNQLDPNTPVTFPAATDDLPAVTNSAPDGLLIGLGGGKDSLVTVEALRDQPRVATWSLNHREQLTPLVEAIDLPHFWVEREWDQQLLNLRDDPEAYNGHIPISAIFACVGTVVALLAGYRDTIVSNESTASEPNLTYQGVAINHQYSKSLEFEQDYQALLQHHFGDSTRYYSFLRPFTELRIAELFAARGFQKYKGVFSSCNRAFVHGSHAMSWCGECAKCAFVFLALTPFIPRQELEALWGGKNLLLDPALEPTYRALLGIEGDKPLDCVGEVKESRAALRLATQHYPELAQKYQFDLPEDYDFRAASPHSLPADVTDLLHLL